MAMEQEGARSRLRGGRGLVPNTTRGHRDLLVHLRGGFRLQVDGVVAELPPVPQRMIALLALRGPMSRSRLAGNLWPDTPEQRALGSLRTSIWRTNQVADQLVVCRGGIVELGARTVVDTRSFIDEAVEIMKSPSAPLDASGLWVGDLIGERELLPDWDDDWLVAERERFRQLLLHVLETVASRLCVAGEYGLAIEAALAALRIDLLRESAHRAVIRVHLAEGNVVEATRALAFCRSTLRHEAGVDVAPETLDLMSADDRSSLVLAAPAPVTPT